MNGNGFARTMSHHEPPVGFSIGVAVCVIGAYSLMLALGASAEGLTLQQVMRDPQHREIRREFVLSTIENKTPSETVALLAAPDYYSVFNAAPKWSGTEFILNPTLGWDLFHRELVASNRVFRKAYAQLAKLPKAEAAAIVSDELESALAAYSNLWHDFEALSTAYETPHGEDMTPPEQTPTSQPPLAMGSLAGESTLMGERLRIFSLVMLAANLGLVDCRDAVQEVITVALTQRAVYTHAPPDPITAQQRKIRLESSSLYNRQVLAAYGITLLENGVPLGVETLDTTVGAIRLQRVALLPYDADKLEFSVDDATLGDTPVGAAKIPIVFPSALIDDPYIESSGDRQAIRWKELGYPTVGFSPGGLDALLLAAGFELPTIP